MNPSYNSDMIGHNDPITETQVNNERSSVDELSSFYRDAFEPLRSERLGECRVYRVFIGRRSFVQACSYVKEHADEIESSVLNTVYSDGGLRILAYKMAEELYNVHVSGDENMLYWWNCQRIILYDDILIYGRALGGLLSAVEEIFADRYLELSGSKENHEQLYDWFLPLISIKTAYKNSRPNLLKIRYRSRLVLQAMRVCEPAEWRRISYEIASRVYRSDVPNAVFIPAIRFDADSEAVSEIREDFLRNQTGGALQNYRYTSNRYNRRKLDTYISCVSSEGKLRAILTLRCTKDYIIPFVFLPSLSESSFSEIEHEIMNRLRKSSAVALNALKAKAQEWRNIDKLNVMYIELINMILGVSLLRSFLDHIKSNSLLMWDMSNEDDINRYTTYQMMMCNYAHDKEVSILLKHLFDFTVPPCFTLEELSGLFVDTLQPNEYIIDDSMIRTSKNLEKVTDVSRVVNKLEKVVFSYGIESEKNAFNLMTGSLSPSYDSIQYFSFPLNNTLSNTLHDIYKNRISWIHDKASVYDIVSYLLQMMDSGCFSLTVGESRDSYLQCLKTGEQSLNTITYRYAMFLPLMNEIVLRCYRQNDFSAKGIYDEFNTFLNKAPYSDRLDEMDKQIVGLYKAIKNQLFDLVNKIVSAGQSCSDYFFLTDIRMKERPMSMKPDEYYNYCSYLYHQVMY